MRDRVITPVWTTLRRSARRAVAALSIGCAILPACASAPALVVTRGGVGQKAEIVPGDALKIQRPALDAYGSARPGWYVIHGDEEWNGLFADSRERMKPPASADFARRMIVMGVAEGTEVSAMKVSRVIDTANTLHVYAREVLRGEGCVRKPSEPPPFDLALVDRMDKPVQFHIDTERAESCGSPPTASVTCRLAAGQVWTAKLEAGPGDAVECEAKSEAKGSFAIVEHNWQLSGLPAGSAAKLTYLREGMRVSFPVDVFGNYGLKFEVTDEAGRKGTAATTVEAAPPASAEAYVQLVWTDFDASDDPSTFPRVQLHASDEAQTPPLDCSLEASPRPAWCDIKAAGPITHLHLKASQGRRFPISVHYTDERVEKGPAICLRVYMNGARTAEACDRKAREADAAWEPGVLNGATGLFEENHPDAGAPKGPKGKTKPATSSTPAKR